MGATPTAARAFLFPYRHCQPPAHYSPDPRLPSSPIASFAAMTAPSPYHGKGYKWNDSNGDRAEPGVLYLQESDSYIFGKALVAVGRFETVVPDRPGQLIPKNIFKEARVVSIDELKPAPSISHSPLLCLTYLFQLAVDFNATWIIVKQEALKFEEHMQPKAREHFLQALRLHSGYLCASGHWFALEVRQLEELSAGHHAK
jgi:hypothetical protein